MFHFEESCEYKVAPPRARTMPTVSLSVKARPSLTQPYVRIIIVLTFEATLNVNALIRPMIKNCDRFNAAAAKPDRNNAISVSLGIMATFGNVSKNGAKKARSNTDIGAWFSNSCGLDTEKSFIFFPIQT